MTHAHARRLQIVTALVFILSIFLSACEGAQEFTIVDLREKLGKVTKETTGDVDNSKGTTDLTSSINVKKQYRHTITLVLNKNANLNEKDVKDRIYDTYDIPNASGEKSCIIPAEVPAGNIYAYNIEWTEVLREGNVQAGKGSNQGDVLGTYTVLVDLQCQVVGAEVKQ